MANWLRVEGTFREPDADVVAMCLQRARVPFAASNGHAVATNLEEVRERLFATMWDDAGIVRDAAGLARAASVLTGLADELGRYRLPEVARDPAFNMTWHDWLNLSSLVDVSRVIVRAAQARENSRGAHYRSDFPEPGDLATSTYTRVRADDRGALVVDMIPVAFTRVRPGQSLI